MSYEGERGKTERIYLCIDLKSFYASVECVERGLDPMKDRLVVADPERTDKTICLAVTPALKALGVPGRCRVFEIPKGIDYQMAPPRMQLYIDYSARIYEVYLRYIAPEDMHVYSIDEVFFDVTDYLKTYRMTARQLAAKMIRDVYETTGISAAAGIGTNLYLAKIAMDIWAKHVEPDRNGVRIAWLDEKSYRQHLWSHRPLTDFWRVGRGYAARLEAQGLYTMGDIARCSVGKESDYYNEELLYRMFGVNAELLIDHAWGFEPCTIADIRAYKPRSSSTVSGQVLHCPYDYEKTRLVVKEMADQLALDLLDKGLVTEQLVLTVGYDRDSLLDPEVLRTYQGQLTVDRYGRKLPKHAHGTINLKTPTSSAHCITEAALSLYERIMNPKLLARKISLSAEGLLEEDEVKGQETFEQLTLFSDETLEEKRRQEEAQRLKERRLQQAMLDIKKRFGKNAILKGMNLEEGATMRERNGQIGGHRA